MKIITLEQARKLLENCAAVLWDDDGKVSHPHLNGHNGQEPFMTLSDDFAGEMITIPGRGNAFIKVVGTSMFLLNSKGEDIQIQLLQPQILE